MEARLVERDQSALAEPPFQHLDAAGPEIEGAPEEGPLFGRSSEPLRLDLGIGPGAEHARRRCRPGALDREGAMEEWGGLHRRALLCFLVPFAAAAGSGAASRSAPRRTNRSSHSRRRSLNQGSTRGTAPAEIPP